MMSSEHDDSGDTMSAWEESLRVASVLLYARPGDASTYVQAQRQAAQNAGDYIAVQRWNMVAAAVETLVPTIPLGRTDIQ